LEQLFAVKNSGFPEQWGNQGVDSFGGLQLAQGLGWGLEG